MMIFAAFALALLLVAGGLIARPFVDPSPDDRVRPGEDDAGALALHDERHRLFDAIRELDADLAVGKLSDTDHRRLRLSYVGRAAVVMQQIEEARATPPAAGDPGSDAALLHGIEEEVRARRDALRGASRRRSEAPDSGEPHTSARGESSGVTGEI